MALRLGSRRWAGLEPPLRLAADRLGWAVVAAACVVLLVLTKLDIQVLTLVQDRAGDVAVPVLRLLDRPVQLARDAADRFGRMLALDAENQRLRQENRRLLAWQAEATRLAVENESLREMLGVPAQVPAPVWTTAQILGDSGTSFAQSRLIDAGSDRGLEAGMPVLTEAGLVGRVIAVGRSSARVLLITDFSSRVPVMLEGSRSRAILAGSNGPLSGLEFLPSTVRPKLGEKVLTSGDGGQLPRGLLVGEIAYVDGEPMVRSLVDWGRLDWVALLRPQKLGLSDDLSSSAGRSSTFGGPR
jgi:rod shape-determining protein MreC